MGNKLQKEIDKKYSSPRLLELERRCNAKQDYTPFLFELGNNYP